MTMDWSNERFIRSYTRDTEDDLLLSYEAFALWCVLMRKLDRAGVLEAKRGAKSVALVVRWPLEVVERVLPELLADGRLARHELGFIAPNFMEAQEAPQSDRQRQKESRARRADRSRLLTPGHDESRAVTNRDGADTNRDSGVTSGHTGSRAVTSCHSGPSDSEPSEPDQISEVCVSPAGARDPATPGPTPTPEPGLDRVRAWTLDLRRRRFRIVEALRADGIGANTPAPSFIVDAKVEAEALHLVQRWAADARARGADVEVALGERGGHLLAVLEAQCRARGELTSLREEVCWSAKVVGWAAEMTPERAAEIVGDTARRNARDRAPRSPSAPPKGPAKPIENYPEATKLRRIGDPS